MDKETVIKGCENWVNNHKGENFLLTYSSVVELLAVLKEQETKTQGTDSGMCEICSFYERAMSVEPLIYHNLFICPMCKNTLFKGQKFCHECGKRIEWRDSETE